eukprot:TRINITY_DN90357_c0_g1_i1.p1 TRINITY_DN90357_c0_g1~~TRINITY_DN90357_c0_g1_i1.p1  ORF type:complete len:580 (+),score=95.61 TRINITY_DN90357_c0_g1_i1:93-1832(+)
MSAPAKVFVGSIPLNCPEDIVRNEFAKFGTVTHFYMKNDPSGPQRSWCFVTYTAREEGQAAIEGTGGKLILPGASTPCEVSWARAAQQGGPPPAVMPGTNINMPPPMPIPGAAPAPGALAAAGSEVATLASTAQSQLVSGPTKLFVGSIPVGITKDMIHQEFSKYGSVAEVFMKNDQTDPDRLWGFVTYSTGEAAALAISMLNETMAFPGGTRPLSVSYARPSGGPASTPAPVPGLGGLGLGVAPSVSIGLTKLFVGSVPGGTTHDLLKSEFEKFGTVTDVFLKNDTNDVGRMWGFVTFSDGASAQNAVQNLNERLVLPGGIRPCNVSYARSSNNSGAVAAQALSGQAIASNKLFLGSIPMGTTEEILRGEFERFGAVTDIFLKNDSSDSTRMWGFLTYTDSTAAAMAVSTLADKLMLPGSTRPVAVSFARQSGGTAAGGMPGLIAGDHGWRVYYNAEGFPYYHHAATNRTTWECPAELTAAAAASATMLGGVGGMTLPGTTLLGGSPLPSADALPEGWNSAVDANTGKTYYYNGTGQVQWERPLDVSKLIGSSAAPSSAPGYEAAAAASLGAERSAPY